MPLHARGLATFSIAVIAIVVAACGGGGATTAPTTGATTAPVATSPAATTAAAASCHEPAAGEATTVEASVAGFEWSAVTAKVGDVITWTNGDSAPHGVKTDDGTCRMTEDIPGNGTGSLVFDKAGTYPITCTVHPNMKGTITIAE